MRVYADAGCVFDVPSAYAEERMGGSANANAAALKDSDRILVEQLAAWSRESTRRTRHPHEER